MARPTKHIGEIARLNVELTKEVHKKFKMLCLQKDMEMSERVREMIDKEIKDSEK